MKNFVCCALACLALGGCLDEEGLDEEGLDEELALAAVEQGVTQTIVHTRNFGGNIFPESFPYVTSQTCSQGFVRREAETQWTSQGGGRCSFQGWLTPNNPADCRANILAQTGGNFFGGTCTTRVTEVKGGTFTYAASNTNSAQALQNTASVSIALSAGQRLTVGTCGIEGATATGDTFLRLIGPPGNQVFWSDDACGATGLASWLTYVAQIQGSYTLRAGCFENTSCSGRVVWHID